MISRFRKYSRMLMARIAGGWWTRPSNWVSNTAIAFSGILAVTYAAWSVSAEKEVRGLLAYITVG